MTTTAARCPRPVVAFAGVLAALSLSASAAGAAPEGEMRWGIHISLAPTYFDPAETPGLTRPFMVLYGSYPDIDGLFQEQASEPDRKRRQATLHRIQQLMHDKAMHAPLMEPAFLNGHGPRVTESGLGLIGNHAYSAPYEDVKLKK